MFSVNECFNLFTWLESRRDEGYRGLISQAWGSLQQKLGVGCDTVYHLLTNQPWTGPLCLPQGNVVSEDLPRQHRKQHFSSTSCFNFGEVSRDLSKLAGRPYNFVISHLYAVYPVVAFPLYKYKARR